MVAFLRGLAGSGFLIASTLLAQLRSRLSCG